MKIQTATLGWSYPTSDNARRFRFYKTGCWTVSLEDKTGKTEAIQAFAPDSKSEAQAFLDWLLDTIRFNRTQSIYNGPQSFGITVESPCHTGGTFFVGAPFPQNSPRKILGTISHD